MISNWAHIKTAKHMNCPLWWYMFEKHGFEQPPSGCQECWKVCVRPATISQLLEIEKLQERTKDKYVGCKCGTEPRDYVNAIYGAYWYANSLIEGRKMLAEVKKDLDSLGLDLTASLKRGCTEYEMRLGDSKEWHLPLVQVAKEKEIEKSLVQQFGKKKVWQVDKQSPEEREQIRKDWIKCACSFGDKEYMKHVDKPLHAVCREYS